MSVVLLQLDVHGRPIEIGCYGSGADWVCRLTDPSAQSARHNDAYSPPPDLGFVWLRESDHRWLASGLVNKEVFRDAGTVDAVLYRIMADVVHDDSQLARCIEFVSADFTVTFDGEQGAVHQAGRTDPAPGAR